MLIVLLTTQISLTFVVAGYERIVPEQVSVLLSFITHQERQNHEDCSDGREEDD